MRITLTLLFFTLYVGAQEHNIWYFGSRAGIDFNSGTPTALSGGQTNTSEGTASIADNEGNLLFYTDGRFIWNKDHQVMENGQDLMGHHSAAQSALIIPKPGSQQHFYVFTVTAWGEADGFRYSEVDMAANAGLGSVTDKNILIQTPVAEAMNATWHSNGEDIWVVVHGVGNNFFSAYLVSSSGVSSNPVTSPSVPLLDAIGQSAMKISPDGSKLALSRINGQNGLHIFDFDNATGLITNPILLHSPGCYGIEFSASGNVLYATRPDSLLQYNLLVTDIDASELVIDTNINVRLAALQRGPDDKIYVARHHQNYISVIHNPDVLGIGCNFQPIALSLLTGNTPSPLSTNGLPNTILSPIFRINSDKQACIGESVIFAISQPAGQFDTVFWEFGDGNTSNQHNPSHAYQQAGSYHVKLTAHKLGVVKTVQSTIFVSTNPQATQPADIVLCDETGNGTALFNLTTQNSVIVGSQEPDNYLITYHISFEDAETGSYSIDENFTNTSNPQTIFARMEAINSECYAITSFNLIVNPKPVIAIADDFFLCKGSTIILEAPEGFDTYHWSTGENSPSIIVDSAGTFSLSVGQTVNGVSCENSKTITVSESESPVIRHINTTEWTIDQNSIMVLVSGNGNYEYSIDGTTYQDSPRFDGLENGIYNVSARDRNGCGTDSREIVLLMYPKFFTPNGDGINDTWRIPNFWFETGSTINISDRYGKIVSSFDSQSAGWDGNYNGNLLPATDYWFIIERRDGTSYRAHFSMIR
ncbi:MAG: hypothetical protein DI539_17655 [Flavobacterium psychrophilum]|nr:MAG: hypothetical protein DI539_17655 [Flavobacterium psychrophilum]